jgi:multisubunit Na+/H+ antiporter MnhG subunit
MVTTDHSKRMDNRTPMQVAGLRGGFIVLAVAATIAYLFVSGHAVAVASVLPFFLFLACPVMMFFMMRGMNHGGQDSGKMKR